MRWLKYFLAIALLMVGLYALSMYYFVEESKKFTIDKEISFPLDKVFPQFNNFQNFTRWNSYFTDSKNLSIDYYSPYQGINSSLSFEEIKGNKSGEMYIKYANPNKTIQYQLFDGHQKFPTTIKVKFYAISDNATKTVWTIQTPKQTLFKRVVNLWTEESFMQDLDKSFVHLKNILGNKVEKEQFLTEIKYDSLMVEKQEGQLVFGVNVTTSNKKKDLLFKNIVMSHNKVYNYIINDLEKRDDEFGFPVLMTNPNSYKDKEVSYFLGIPLSKRESVADNNFIFKTVNETQVYSIYFKGNYENRKNAIQQLMNKARKDTMRNGELQQVFLETPEEGKEVLMKLSLPVYR